MNSDSVEAILERFGRAIVNLPGSMTSQEAKAALDRHYASKFIELLTPEPQHADYNPEILKAVQQRNLVKAELRAKIKELLK